MIDFLQLNTVTFLSVCCILLVLIGVSLLLGHLTGPQGIPPKTITDPESLMAPSAYKDISIKFPSPSEFRALLTLTDDEIIIGEPPIATIDINTGDVELHGKPNDAALLFWEAVEEMKP